MREFELPDWVPPGVARAIDLLEASGSMPVSPHLLRRLATDRRMQNVWTELTRKVRNHHEASDRPFRQGRLPNAVRTWRALAIAEREQGVIHRELGDRRTAEAYTLLADKMDEFGAARSNPAIDEAQEHQGALALVFLCALSLYASRLRSVSKADVQAWRQKEIAAGRPEISASATRSALRGRRASSWEARRR